jgi:hypothetical protein
VRKIISILLISTLLFDAFGYIFVYLQVGFYFKSDALIKINDYIPDNELEKITVAKADMLKKDLAFEILNETEITYGNKMYDVYKIENDNDSVHYYCICDDNESVLESAFAVYLKEKTDTETKNSPIHNILDNLIREAITSNITFDFKNESETQNYIPNQNSTYQIIFDIPTPPPRA